MSDSFHEIVVGHDGSIGSRCALDWASDEAARRGADLRIVYAADPAVLPPSTHLGQWDLDRFGEAAASTLESGVAHARRRHPDLSVGGEVMIGEPVEALAKVSLGTNLLAVGSHGQGDVPDMRLGSVATALAGAATCTVVITRGNAYLPGRLPIVVAYDRSAASTAALEYGIHAAGRAQAGLLVVSAWRSGIAEPWAQTFWHNLYPNQHPGDEARVAAEAALAEAVSTAKRLSPLLQVETHIEEGNPATVLIKASRSGGQIVTGVGPGRISGLGSVDHALINEASCPVVLVPVVSMT